jgi:hypothetical protein
MCRHCFEKVLLLQSRNAIHVIIKNAARESSSSNSRTIDHDVSEQSSYSILRNNCKFHRVKLRSIRVQQLQKEVEDFVAALLRNLRNVSMLHNYQDIIDKLLNEEVTWNGTNYLIPKNFQQKDEKIGKILFIANLVS